MLSRHLPKLRAAWSKLRGPWRDTPVARISKKLVRVCLVVLGVLVVGYFVVGNVFLDLGGVSWLVNRETDGVRIEYSSAWSWWPGKVRVRDFRLAFRNDDVQFEVALDSADADISLVDLFHKRFVARSVLGQGLVYRMRLLRPPEALLDERSNEALPRIPGFDDLPVREFTVPTAPPREGHYDLWTVSIANIDSTLKEVWVEQIRVTGEGRIRGGFSIEPMHHGRIDDVHGVLKDGRVDRGPVTLADDLQQRFEARVPWFDCSANGAKSLEENLDAVIEGRALVASAEIVNAIPFFHEHGLWFEDGSGSLRAKVAIERGRLNPGSEVRVDTSNVVASAPGVRIDASHGTIIRFLGKQEGIDLTIESKAVDLVPTSLPRALLHAENPSADFHFRDDPALVNLAFVGIGLEVPASNTSLAALDGHLGPIRIHEGAGFARLSGHIGPDGSANGELNLAALGLDVHGGRARVRGEARAKIAFSSPSLGALRFDLGPSTVDVRNVDLVVGDAHPPPWWGHTELDKGSLEIGKHGPLFDLPVRGSFQDASPIVAIFKGEEVVPGFAANLLTMKGLRASAEIRRNERVIDVDIRDARGDGGAVQGIFIAGDDVERGAFRFHAGILALGVSFREGGPKLQLVPTAEWLDDERRELRSTIPTKRMGAARPSSAHR